MSSKIVIVDENDNEIGVKERGTLNLDDIYRVSALWVTNSQGEILLAQRSFNKTHNPGKWGPAVAGTIEEGETYDSNIEKEAEEELGLSGVKFVKGPKLRISSDNNKYNFFGQWYFSKIDKKLEEFIIRKEEVEKIKWFSREELEKCLEENSQDFFDNIRGFLDFKI